MIVNNYFLLIGLEWYEISMFWPMQLDGRYIWAAIRLFIVLRHLLALFSTLSWVPEKLVAFMTPDRVIIRSHVCTTDVSRQWLDPIRQPVVEWHTDQEWLDPIKLSRPGFPLLWLLGCTTSTIHLIASASVHTKINGHLKALHRLYFVMFKCYLFQILGLT